MVLFRAALPQPKVVAFFIFLLALIVRLIFCAQWHATAYGPLPILDARAYDEWAKDVASGHFLHGQAFYQLPLFPYALGLLYAVFGSSVWVASIFNALVGAVTCAVLALTAFELFGLVAAWATGIFATLYGPFIFYTSPVMKEPLGLLLLALALFFTMRAIGKQRLSVLFWAGFLLGLATLVRGNVLALAVILPFVLWRQGKRKLEKKCCIYLLGLLLAIAPVTIHNAIVSHDFVPISYADGFNAYIGHGPFATGTSYVFPPGVTSNPAREEFDITHIAETELGRRLKPSEVSAYWRQKALSYALGHPMHEWDVLINKLRAFWSNDEPYDNYDMSFIAKNFSTILMLPLPGFGLVAVLGIFGASGVTRKRRSVALILLVTSLIYMVSLFPFYVTDRYRLPVVVFLLPLAGAGVDVLIRLYMKRSWKSAWKPAVAATAMLMAAFWPGEMPDQDDAYDWSMLSTIYEDEGQHLSSVEAFMLANSIDYRKVGSDAWIKVSIAQGNLGRKDIERSFLEKATKVFPDDGSVTYNYARLIFLDGDYATASNLFRKAIEQTPTFTPGYRGLAVSLDRLGRRQEAMDALGQGLQIVPNDSELVDILAQIQGEKLIAQ